MKSQMFIFYSVTLYAVKRYGEDVFTRAARERGKATHRRRTNVPITATPHDEVDMLMSWYSIIQIERSLPLMLRLRDGKFTPQNWKHELDSEKGASAWRLKQQQERLGGKRGKSFKRKLAITFNVVFSCCRGMEETRGWRVLSTTIMMMEN